MDSKRPKGRPKKYESKEQAKQVQKYQKREWDRNVLSKEKHAENERLRRKRLREELENLRNENKRLKQCTSTNSTEQLHQINNVNILSFNEWIEKVTSQGKYIPIGTIAFFPNETPSMTFHRSPNCTKLISDLCQSEQRRAIKNVMRLSDALVGGNSINIMLHTDEGKSTAIQVLSKYIDTQKRKAIQQYRKELTTRFTLSALVAFKGIKISNKNFELLTQALTRTSYPESLSAQISEKARKNNIPQCLLKDTISKKIHDLYIEKGGMENTFDCTIAKCMIEWLKNSDVDDNLKESVHKSLWNSKISSLQGNAGVKVKSVYCLIQQHKLELFKEEILQEISELGGIELVEKQKKWNDILLKYDDIKSFLKVDCVYFLRYCSFRWFEKAVPEEQRKKYRRLYTTSSGFQMPKVASIKSLKLELYKHIFGQWDFNEENYDNSKTDGDWISIFTNDELSTYIGIPINMKVDEQNITNEDLFRVVEETLEKAVVEENPIGSILQGRVVSMRISFIQMICYLEQMQVFKPEIKRIEWLVVDWLDGAKVDGSTLLLGIIFFYLNRSVFIEEKYEIAFKIIQNSLLLWFLGFGSECIINVKNIQKSKVKNL